MVGVTGNVGKITRTAHDKVRKERNATYLCHLQVLKEKYSVTLQETESLEQQLENIKDEIVTKNAFVENIKRKYTEIKEKKKKLRERICELRKGAETNNSKINTLIQVRLLYHVDGIFLWNVCHVPHYDFAFTG